MKRSFGPQMKLHSQQLKSMDLSGSWIPLRHKNEWILSLEKCTVMQNFAYDFRGFKDSRLGNCKLRENHIRRKIWAYRSFSVTFVIPLGDEPSLLRLSKVWQALSAGCRPVSSLS